MSRFKWQNAECSFWRSKLWKPVAVGQVFLSHWSLSAGRVPAVGLIFTLISPALLMQTELTSALQVSHSTPNPFSHHCSSSNAKSYLLSLIPADPQLLVSFPVLLHSSLCLFFCSPFFLTALIFFPFWTHSFSSDQWVREFLKLGPEVCKHEQWSGSGGRRNAVTDQACPPLPLLCK